LWSEFEQRITPEAKFAAALDRLEPVMQNYINKGDAWKEHNIAPEKVLALNKQIKDGSEKLWKYARSIIEKTFLL
jgi:putative hydrolases of HD superfamily